MSSFPVQAISVDNIKAKFKEDYVSSAMNRKLSGYPIGVYRGFTAVATGPDEVQLAPDANFNDHVGMVEVPPAYMLHVRFTGTITLDFTGHNWTTDPVVYLCLRSDYVPPPSGSASAQIQTLTPSQIPTPGSATFGQIVKICKVTKPAASVVVSMAIPSDRQTPFAYTGTTSGFMPGGSIEQLLEAILTTQEVEQARTGLRVPKLTNGTGGNIVLQFTQGSTAVTAVGPGNLLAECSNGDSIQAPDGTFVIVAVVLGNTSLTLATPYISTTAVTSGVVQHGFASLDARLDAELAASGANGMASRLANEARPVLGGLYVPTTTPGWPYVTITPPATSFTKANVSNDFRTIEVASVVGGKGACADPPDSFNNTCDLVDIDFNEIIEDSTLRRIYGRLKYNSVVLTGVLSFTNGSTAVTGDLAATFTSQVIVGDIVEGPDFNFYTVIAVADDQHLTLGQNFSGTTGTISSSNRRRWTLEFQTRTHDGSNAPLDAPIALLTGQSFRYYFQQVFDAADHPPFSDVFLRFKNKSAANVPDASTTVKGKVLLGTSSDVASGKVVQTNDTRLGTIIAKQGLAGSPLGPEPIMTFIAGSNMASVTVIDTGSELQITFNAATQSGGGGGASLGTATPLPDGNAAVGVSSFASHEDHVHPRDFSIFTGAGTVNATPLTFNPGFVPRLYLHTFVNGSIAGFGFAAGPAVGSAPPVQASAETGAGLHLIAKDNVYADTGGNSINVTSFTSSAVTLARNLGTATVAVSAAILGTT